MNAETEVGIVTDLKEEERLFRDMVREFARNEIGPIAAEIDETSRFPAEIVAKMGPLGLLGIPVPEEYGGAGCGSLSYILALEEVAYVCGSTALTLAAHTSLATLPILNFGTEEQKQRYIPDLAAGRKIGAFGLTESHAGSDAAGTRTRAVRKGANYVLNGSKCYITNASHASVFVVTARTSDAPGSRGISSFIVEREFPGFSVGKKEDKLGLRGSDTAEILFSDCSVPAANLLGKEGEGFRNFMRILDGGRIGIGAMALGIGQAAFDFAARYASGRQAFGQSVATFGAIQEKLANMAVSLHAARLLVYDTARRRQAGRPHTKEASMTKLFASEAAYAITKDAIQVLGGNGYSREYPLERFFRDVKLLEIGEGTSEIQRLVIARSAVEEISGE
ncbi:MAG TPA: acyl-CoA dehydrogenase [Planctomycetota bacterium]|jgi:alkylation response protein AidB-like acyl-CoA dehydrogenase|nr:acyl-CoA dehydrogenase [Planctomycetota bacterium]